MTCHPARHMPVARWSAPPRNTPSRQEPLSHRRCRSSATRAVHQHALHPPPTLPRHHPEAAPAPTRSRRPAVAKKLAVAHATWLTRKCSRVTETLTDKRVSPTCAWWMSVSPPCSGARFFAVATVAHTPRGRPDCVVRDCGRVNALLSRGTWWATTEVRSVRNKIPIGTVTGLLRSTASLTFTAFLPSPTTPSSTADDYSEQVSLVRHARCSHWRQSVDWLV
jgi:hypothetical protein